MLPVKCIDKLKMSNTQTILPLVLFWKIQHLLKLAILSYLTLMIDYLLLGKRRCVSDIFLNWDHTLYVSVVTNEGATFLETAQYPHVPNWKYRKQKCYRDDWAVNGPISNILQLSVTVHCFTGGSPYILTPSHILGFNDIFNSIWIVIDALNQHSQLTIQFPT